MFCFFQKRKCVLVVYCCSFVTSFLSSPLVRLSNPCIFSPSAHHVTGTLVKQAEARGCGLEELSLADMTKVEPGITKEVFAVLGVDKSVKSRTSYGGTAPSEVRKQITRWKKRLADV